MEQHSLVNLTSWDYIDLNSQLSNYTNVKEIITAIERRDFNSLRASLSGSEGTLLTLTAQFNTLDAVKECIEKYEIDARTLGAQGRNCFHSAAAGGNDETLLYIGELSLIHI